MELLRGCRVMAVRAVDRANALLTVVIESNDPRTFASLVDELGVTKSTTSRQLHALERSRLVQPDRSGAFHPGPLFSLYAAQLNAVHDLAELSRPTLERLSEPIDETTNLSVSRRHSRRPWPGQTQAPYPMHLGPGPVSWPPAYLPCWQSRHQPDEPRPSNRQLEGHS